jgi:putative membrane protein
VKAGAIIGGIVGLALSVWLVESIGIARIPELFVRAGIVGVLAVTMFHVSQMLFSALSWRAIAGPAASQPRLARYLTLRWVRESVNNLLPFAQIGGEIVVSRLLQQAGIRLADAIAGTVADLSIEVATQVLFTLLGLLLLLKSGAGSEIAAYLITGVSIAALAVAALFGALVLGLSAALEKALMKLGHWIGWGRMLDAEGLHDALMRCYRAPARVLWSTLWHMISWLLGGIEVCLILHFFGRHVGIGDGLIIESIGQAFKAVGFAVPGAIGVQEGGYVAICHALGMTPELGMALSLMKRVRELLLGFPGLLFWYRIDGRTGATPDAAVPGVVE